MATFRCLKTERSRVEHKKELSYSAEKTETWGGTRKGSVILLLFQVFYRYLQQVLRFLLLKYSKNAMYFLQEITQRYLPCLHCYSKHDFNHRSDSAGVFIL